MAEFVDDNATFYDLLMLDGKETNPDLFNYHKLLVPVEDYIIYASYDMIERKFIYEHTPSGKFIAVGYQEDPRYNKLVTIYVIEVEPKTTTHYTTKRKLL